MKKEVEVVNHNQVDKKILNQKKSELHCLFVQYLSVCLSVCLFLPISVFIIFHWYLYLSIYLLIDLFVYIYFCWNILIYLQWIHTHTYTYIFTVYIYIYIYREREMEINISLYWWIPSKDQYHRMIDFDF